MANVKAQKLHRFYIIGFIFWISLFINLFLTHLNRLSRDYVVDNNYDELHYDNVSFRRSKHDGLSHIPFEYYSEGRKRSSTRKLSGSDGQGTKLFTELTGSWANCQNGIEEKYTSSRSVAVNDQLQLQHLDPKQQVETQDQLHPDQKVTTVSCHEIIYRVKESSFEHDQDLIVGIVSSSLSNDKNNNHEVHFQRRESIRQTWGLNQTGIFFIVDDHWEDIQDEYEQYSDLIWIEKESMIHGGSNGSMTYITQAFLRIVHDFSTKFNIHVKQVLKTVDDAYVNMKALREELVNTNASLPSSSASDTTAATPPKDYWGICHDKKTSPKRSGNTNDKVSLSFETYPEAKYPRFCQGTSYALSWNFIQCVSNNNHIGSMRFMPLEDVSIGLLAERCAIEPSTIAKREMINMYRTEGEEEKRRLREGLPPIMRMKIPIPRMHGRIIQHYIYDDLDMREHHNATILVNRVNFELKRKAKLRERERKMKMGGRPVFWDRHRPSKKRNK